MTTTTTTISTHVVTAQQDSVHRGHVEASLNFYEPPTDGSKPYGFVEKQPEGVPQQNYGTANRKVLISDIRGHESSYDIATSAFGTLQDVSETETDWHDDESIKKTYYPQVEKVLLDQLGLSKEQGARVLIFDHTIRLADPNAHRTPVNRTHIDQTPKSAAQRVKVHLPDEAETLLKGRYRLINVWRPLNGPVESFPLAFADARTVKDEDVVPVEHRYPDRTGETASIKYDPKMHWYYWSGMQNSERMLLQCFDSKNQEVRVPHTAFVDERSGEGAKPRESIEVRALIFG